jgi:protein gp37
MADQRDGGIAWTDETWNVLRGCSKVSDGCTNCYAEGMAARFSGPGLPFDGLIRDGRWNGTVRLVGDRLTAPLRWRRPRRVFVTSVSDPFHPSVTDDMLDRIFAVMALSPQHTFQLVTKRPERMRGYYAGFHHPSAESRGFNVCAWASEEIGITDEQIAAIGSTPKGLPNVWLGVSVENQATADERIPHLLATPAAVRFISAEPLLGTDHANASQEVAAAMRRLVEVAAKAGVDAAMVAVSFERASCAEIARQAVYDTDLWPCADDAVVGRSVAEKIAAAIEARSYRSGQN